MTSDRLYEPRTYRHHVTAAGPTAFSVAVGESNIQILAGTTDAELLDRCKAVALAATREARQAISSEGLLRPAFLTSLTPLGRPATSHPVVHAMSEAAQLAGVGPMAAVAGAIAEHVARALAELVDEVVVENGGDLFLRTAAQRTIAVWAGRSQLSGRVALQVPPGAELGICTSSATVGPSYSAGRADAALVAAADAAFADAMASALGNRVLTPADAGPAVEWALTVDGVVQALVIIGDTLAVGGELDIVRV